jgi:hypothetical protein
MPHNSSLQFLHSIALLRLIYSDHALTANSLAIQDYWGCRLLWKATFAGDIWPIFYLQKFLDLNDAFDNTKCRLGNRFMWTYRLHIFRPHYTPARPQLTERGSPSASVPTARINLMHLGLPA